MQDQNIRKAIEMGIDKEGFCSVIMEGRGLPAKAAFPDSFSYGNEAVETVSYDPEGAKSCWKNPDGRIQTATDMQTRTDRSLP